MFNVLLFAHFLGMATLIGALFAQWFGKPGVGISTAWFWGALVQALTGLAMLGMRDAGVAETPVDSSGHIKLGVKLVVLLVITVLAVVGRNRPAKAKQLGLIMGALTVLNIAIAVFWG